MAEWITASAPSASGCWLTGVANVLSTTTRASPLRAITPAMSMTSRRGFVGVSTQTIFVCGVTAAASASRSVWSTIVYRRPQRASTLSTSR